MNKSELLLPAGNEESLRAAIANGADAVYFAGAAFGARAGADNFSREALPRALELCRLHRVKAYITMNTLLGDGELPAALEMAKFLYDQGADALILQDFGFAAAVRSLLPSFPLHGSTQMTVHNAATARFCQAEGFRRVILARELTLTEIAAVAAAVPDLELEVFVHGALCICYSGQCLLSSLIGGRSGNRGKCAQPCRMLYELHEAGKGALTEKPLHLLSPKDLCSLDFLDELLALPVAALKIEGRMRRPEYVATVGRVYRRALDAYYGDGPGPAEEDLTAVAQVFNRDFTGGYGHGNPGAALMSHQRPNNRGVFLGRVKEVRGRRVILQLEKPLLVGDGVEIWVKVGGRLGAAVESIRVAGKETDLAKPGDLAEIWLDGRISIGDRVFKTYDHALMTAARDSYSDLPAAMPLYLTVRARLGEMLYLEARDGQGRTASYETDYQVEAALKTASGPEAVEKQLCRLGGSGYELVSLQLDMDDGVLLPASVLNQARRELTADLAAQSRAVYPKVGAHDFRRRMKALLAAPEEGEAPAATRISVKVKNLAQAKAALLAGADMVYYGPYLECQPMTAGDWADFAALVKEHRGRLAFAAPSLHPESEAAAFRRDIAKAAEFCPEILLGQAGDITALQGLHFTAVYGDFSLNVMNRQTHRAIKERGFCRLTYSLELNREDLAVLDPAAEVVVHGFLPVMVSRHCLIGAVGGRQREKVPCGISCRGRQLYLVDRMQVRFPVYGDVYHQMRLYNGRELALVTEAAFLRRFAWWRIEGQLYGEKELAQIVSLYREAAREYRDGEALASLLNRMRAMARYPYTKGHFYRGVK